MQPNLKQIVKQKAYELGFEKVGVAAPETPPHYSIYKGWVKAGHHAEMAYMATERAQALRKDPLKILPECASILILAYPYPAPAIPIPEKLPTTNNYEGRVAAYACGQDYHNVLPVLLDELIHFIEEQCGHSIQYKKYTDTGPILERDFASLAGLGWIGKNTCLIMPKAGSFFLLAEILLSLPLEPDQPFLTDHCGNCTRCIDACPTTCILPNRTIDSNRCISYLTIENKGPIDPSVRSLLKTWVFGCDICQEVCPWNIRFTNNIPENKPTPPIGDQPEFAKVNLHEVFELSPEEFNKKYKETPIKRAKRRGYLRNAAIALGNIGSRASLPVLEKVLAHETEPLVRQHAAWALGQIGGETARLALVAAQQQENDVEVQQEIQDAIDYLQQI